MIRHYPLTILCTIAIWLLSLFPLSLPETITGVPFYDKWGHMLMYGVFAIIMLAESWRSERSGWRNAYIWRMAAIALMSGLLEILQEYATSTRSGEVADFLANTTGVVLGTLIMLPLLCRMRR